MPSLKFSFGRVVCTPGALEKLDPQQIAEMVGRHGQLDEGTLTAFLGRGVAPKSVPTMDVKENELSLREGFRIFSSFVVDGVDVWIITEADRSATTVLLPQEY